MPAGTEARRTIENNQSSGSGCTESNVLTGAEGGTSDAGEPIYVCQATQLPYATSDLDWWDIRKYLDDYSSGNVGLWRIICGGVYFLSYWLSRAGIGVGRPMHVGSTTSTILCGTARPSSHARAERFPRGSQLLRSNAGPSARRTGEDKISPGKSLGTLNVPKSESWAVL